MPPVPRVCVVSVLVVALITHPSLYQLHLSVTYFLLTAH